MRLVRAEVSNTRAPWSSSRLFVVVIPGTKKSHLPRDVEPLGCGRAGGEVHRVVARWAVREERGDVGDGSHQQRADLGVLVVGQRDDHVVLVPHVESVVRKRVRRRKVAVGRALRGFVLIHFFIINRTQHTI